jgi:hypothetical protein
VQVLEVESGAEGAGWSGAFDDRWHSTEAFQNPFRDEFRDGLVAYLKTRGFEVRSSAPLRIRVSLDGFEGWRRIREKGGDLVGSATILLAGHPVAQKRLFESLSYRDDDSEVRGFTREFGVRVRFDTVIFFRLWLSFYKSIAALLLENAEQVVANSVPLAPATGASPARNPEAEAARGHGVLNIESEPPEAEIFLEGNLIGTTPAREVRLPAGDYTIVLRREGSRTWSGKLWFSREPP